MRFNVGDKVVVAEAKGYEAPAVAHALYRGWQGAVTGVGKGVNSPYPYEVSFTSGGMMSFAEHELELSDSEERSDSVTSLSLAPEVAKSDHVSPDHYTGHPSGVECIEIVKHMNFPLGNAVKYIWRAGLKDDAITDLEKAKRYIEIEIERIRESA
ncbi:DUF3310 domain-containing protein [Streptomyces noursei]|uniref:DUF3310 domain-containing protein n=1 Tax=Streptomyces noursei TaxID=1971 RepID=UPI0019AFAEDD|nr:DUF3310 domain-containing protein [Streptomyces noursei]MCZ1015590.1 DUF3310 domain-containing protein [Streptomyces noursei]GGW89313.1 hypothetical protein GCM10010341_07620 [Streptomyces noursei]